ncbi:MAG: hypothetical protein AAF682_24205 [Planctomycetota bacterium]
MRSALTTSLLASVLAGLFACAGTPSHELEAMYLASRDEDSHGSSAGELYEIEQQRREWIGVVRELYANGDIQTDLDRLYAAELLLESDSTEDLGLARDLALEAAENGDDRGFPLAAEAIDRSLMKQGLPQRYGTQYVYLPEFGWILYRWNERVTDAERTAMGVPPIQDSLERLKRLNAKERAGRD